MGSALIRNVHQRGNVHLSTAAITDPKRMLNAKNLDDPCQHTRKISTVMPDRHDLMPVRLGAAPETRHYKTDICTSDLPDRIVRDRDPE